ncbi:hypothetical protein BB561_004964 [Smittium simulii]|uniref:Uncharacterized protein n=1 Tax=Smittium simulii TaxID=133385 RepID=A0A2T9YD16_9FUNG|nr:hypothetical protein BB561_004964 [Smittium simulii]
MPTESTLLITPEFSRTDSSQYSSTIEINTKPNNKPSNHSEKHLLNTQVLRDAIIGLADGLTVPFALAAGLVNLGDSKIVIIAGFAELIAGSISMGLGGYLATESEVEHYDAEKEREQYEVLEYPEAEEQEIVTIFEPYGVTKDDLKYVLDKLKKNPIAYVDFMMKFELNMERPDSSKAWISAATIGISYFVGGIIPLLPYLFFDSTYDGLFVSSILTLFTLFIFGIFRAHFIGLKGVLKSALHTMMIGSIAAGASYFIVKLVGA